MNKDDSNSITPLVDQTTTQMSNNQTNQVVEETDSTDWVNIGIKQAQSAFKKQLASVFGTPDLDKIAAEYNELKSAPNRKETLALAKELAAKEKALEDLSNKHNELSQKLLDYQLKVPLREAINKAQPKRPEYAKILESEALPRIKLADDGQTIMVLNKQGKPTEGKDIMNLDDLINEIAGEMPELVSSLRSGHNSGYNNTASTNKLNIENGGILQRPENYIDAKKVYEEELNRQIRTAISNRLNSKRTQ